jgi:outer membrane protein assembly factor BamD
MIKHGPLIVQAAHVGDPTMTAPQRTIAPTITRQNQEIFTAAFKAAQPGVPTTEAAAPTPTGVNEPPRSDQPQAPLQFENVPGAGQNTGANSLGVSIVSGSAPAAAKPADDPNAVVKSVGTTETALPAAEAPAPAPDQVNDIKPGSTPAQNTAADAAKGKTKKPKLDQSDESSSKKKKKKGIAKLNPF